VGELPLDLQAKLLRVLQEREFERVGGSETVRVDVRLLAATNRDLRDMVARGKFREDLYYRLNVFPSSCHRCARGRVTSPSSSTPSCGAFSRQAGKRIDGVAPAAMQRLEAYRWPGNVRELQNVVERAVILATGPTIGLEALPDLGAGLDAGGLSWVAPLAGPSFGAAPSNEAAPHPAPRAPVVRPPNAIDEVERDYVAQILQDTAWVIEGRRGAARLLGLHPNTLRSRMKRWGLKRPGEPQLAAV